MKITRLAPALLVYFGIMALSYADGFTPEIIELQGVYKDQFENGMVDGTAYKSENIFEFVGLKNDTAYIKIHLEFYNGHECGLSGIVRQQADKTFIFQDPDIESGCSLQIKFDGTDIHFSDDEQGNCQKFCGARGGFSGAGFSRKLRRDIKYMKLILNSEEYKEAVDNYNKRHPENK